MKTRAKKGSASKKIADEAPPSQIAKLDDSVAHPPKVFVFPEHTSEEARVVSIPDPATGTPNRYLVCPKQGFYDFTRVAAPKRACRSWLFAPKQPHHDGDATTINSHLAANSARGGYILQSPEMMVATPIDPLFLVLPTLAEGEEEAGGMQIFLSLSDYVDKLETRAPHFKEVMRIDRRQANRLDTILESRIAAVCDELETGDEKLYKLANQKLLDVLVNKARRMVENGLPASMEDRFVKQPLVLPMMSVKREQSSVSFTSVEGAGTGASQDEASSASTRQDSQSSSTTTASTATAATSIAPVCDHDTSAPTEIVHLLRLRTALDFLLRSYIAPALRKTLDNLINSSVCLLDFKPLDAHLEHIEKLKQDAHALRTMSENISRKRGIEDDDEALEKEEAKKRKKEQEDFRKKNTSRGVQQLKKADTSGMKKLSSFFTKGPAKKS